MSTPSKPSQQGIDLIKEFEGFRANPYSDTGGVWTIGFGHTKGITKNSPSISPIVAEGLLRIDVAHAEKAVQEIVLVPLSQSQIDALVSFTYNVGNHAFKTSTLVKKLNSGDFDGATLEFARWKYDNGVVIAGLVNRREKEALLFSG